MSTRALGKLYRAVDLKDPPNAEERKIPSDTEDDSITGCLRPRIQQHLISNMKSLETGDYSDVETVFDNYQEELGYICTTHVVTNVPGARLTEEEIVTGTISAKYVILFYCFCANLISYFSRCAQGRWRNERIYRMRLNSSSLMHETKRQLKKDWKDNNGAEKALAFAWRAWLYSTRNRSQFGANSFGLVALGLIFETLEALEETESS